jgi:amino acid permease
MTIHITGFEEVLPSKSYVRNISDPSPQMAGPVGTFQTCFNMLKIFLGIGILATPETFKKIGLVGGVLGLLLIGLLNGYTMML